jgi:hypothetical protein
MASNIDDLVSRAKIPAEQGEVVIVPLKPFAENAVPANALPCGAQCPMCSQDGTSGSCMLEAGHTEMHQCNVVSTHQWSGPDSIPGPHGP